MPRDSRITLHYLLRAVFTGGFSLYILYLVRADKLVLFIAPRMEMIVKLSAVVLALFAAYFVFAAVWAYRGEQASDCGCDHGPKKAPFRNLVTYSLFAAPLLLGWFVPDSIMGSNVVDQKGIVLASNASSAEQPVSSSDSAPAEGGLFYADDAYTKQYSAFAERLFLQDKIVVEEASFLEAITAIDLFMNAFQGKSIEISGFVYRQPDMTDSQFVIARLAMECCSADSTPYGFLVEWPDSSTLVEDTWITVSGTIDSSVYNDARIVTLRATDVTTIATPSTPYVYPNYDILENP
ncbi:TIGR03943 family protein [Paenibacillus sp. TRM 82003]|nr:TIGR03943 family protein [Paenibacillus sp. TRM 82003]